MQGQPFAPHPRLEAILDNAARTAAAISRVLVYAPRDPDAIIFEGSSWRRGFIGGRPRWSLPRPRIIQVSSRVDLAESEALVKT